MFQRNLKTLLSRAHALLEEAMAEQKPIIVAWSGGKDSSCILNLVLQAARAHMAKGKASPVVVVTHANTLVENPAMQKVADQAMDEFEAYAERNGIELFLRVVTPSLNSQWAVKVLGGRDLPVFSGLGGNRKCTQDMKLKPQEKILKKLVKKFRSKGVEPVTVLGTRFAESVSREKRMKGRGETPHAIWTNEDGHERLSPIADWSDLELWSYLHACASGELVAYSDFSDLIRIYRDASDPTKIQRINGVEVYAARFGCSVCTAGQDHSMYWLLRNNPERYWYMAGLYRLQKYMLDTQHDLSRRQWVSFALHKGYAKIRPNTYSPSMLEELLRYCLTLDAIEREASGGNPRFQLITLEALIAISAQWSYQGHHKPYHGLKVFREVVLQGKLATIPALDKPVEQTEVGPPRYLYVGEGYLDPYYRYDGLFDVEYDMVAFDKDSSCIGLKTLKDGREVWDLPTTPSFSVNMEAVAFLLQYELDELVDVRGPDAYRCTVEFTHYASVGYISLAKGSQTSVADKILRRTTWKEDKGLLGIDPRIDEIRLQNILDESISEKEWMAATGQNPKASKEKHDQFVLPGLDVAA